MRWVFLYEELMNSNGLFVLCTELKAIFLRYVGNTFEGRIPPVRVPVNTTNNKFIEHEILYYLTIKACNS